MQAPDLRIGPPPRWNQAVDGVVWLPRFAAKARAHSAETLGMYLYGQSPIDDAFLKRAGLTYASFSDIVSAQPNDAAVLAEIEHRTPGATAALRRWSERLPAKAGWFLALLDLDDGYGRRPFGRMTRAVTNVCAIPIVLIARAWRR